MVEKSEKNTDNSEKYSGTLEKYYWEEYENFGEIVEIQKNTVKPKKRSSLHFGRKTRKNTLNLEKYSGKSGKIIQLRKTQQKYTKSGKIPQNTQKNISETPQKRSSLNFD